MISSTFSNRLVFIFSLAGLLVSSFLLYEYILKGPIICPTGLGCDIVRASRFANLFGIPIPVLGVIFYLVMGILTVIHAQEIFNNLLFKLKLLISIAGVGFGVYLTYLEFFVIKAICFWCVLSFIISWIILLSVILERKCDRKYL